MTPPPPPTLAPTTTGHRLRGALRFSNVGAVYVWLAIIVLFSILKPDSFPTVSTVRQILNGNAVNGMVTLSLVIPMACGVFDVSVGNIVGCAGVGAAWLMLHTTWSPWLVILLTVLGAALLGVVNGLVVVQLKVTPLIGTLGTGAAFLSLTKLISDEKPIQPARRELAKLVARGKLWGITTPVFLTLAVMIVVAYLLEATTVGRAWYATGFDATVARLAGLRVKLLQFSALMICAGLAGLAGIIVTARTNTGSPEAGPSYLLPAFAAVFLGATQFRGGRFNAWGAMVAVLMLGTGEVGLSQLGAPTWTPSLLQGVVLIASMALARRSHD